MVRVEAELAPQFGHLASSTLHLLLKQATLTKPAPPAKTTPQGIPVGRHRTQMDVQQLPVIEGGNGFEYEVSIIHLDTRIKYSEIHASYGSPTIAGVFERSLDCPPSFLSPSRIMP